jgi:hypothetical protein
MRWVLITPFGTPVEPEVNRIFAIVSGPNSGVRAVDHPKSAAISGCEANRVVAVLRRRIANDDDFKVPRHHRLDGAAEHLAVVGKDETGRQQFENMPELAEVFRDQRIGGRDRHIGHADIIRREAHQGMFNTVARQKRDRAFRRKIAREQPLADRPHAGAAFRHRKSCRHSPLSPRCAMKVRSGAVFAQYSRRSVIFSG